MRSLVFVFLTVAAFHTAHSASLESAQKDEAAVPYDELTALQKIDQMEFEAAQKIEAAQLNDTEGRNEDIRYLEAVHDESEEEHVAAEDVVTEGGGVTDAAAHEGSESESSEEVEDHIEAENETASSVDEASQNSTKEPDVLE